MELGRHVLNAGEIFWRIAEKRETFGCNNWKLIAKIFGNRKSGDAVDIRPSVWPR